MGNLYLITGLVIFLYLLFCFFNTIKKSIKLLFSKDIYKIDKEHKLRDIIELTIISILLVSIFAVIIVIINFFLPRDNCYRKYDYFYYSIQTKRCVSVINTAFNLEYKLNKKISLNEDEFLNFFRNRVAHEEFYNIKENSSTKIKKINKKHIKSEKNKNGIDKELADKPCFEVAGALYFINRYQNGCKNVDLEHPENSDCYMTIDLNGFEQPNKLIEIDKDIEHLHKVPDGDSIIVVIQPQEKENQPNLTAIVPEKYQKLLKPM